MPGDNRTDDYPAHDDLYCDEIAREIADSVARVKDPYDRIGGLYEMAYKGALAGLTYWTNN